MEISFEIELNKYEVSFVANFDDTLSVRHKLVHLNAMKMEHALLAPRDGVVAEVVSSSSPAADSRLDEVMGRLRASS